MAKHEVLRHSNQPYEHSISRGTRSNIEDLLKPGFIERTGWVGQRIAEGTSEIVQELGGILGILGGGLVRTVGRTTKNFLAETFRRTK